MLIKSDIISLLNRILNQTVRLRKGGNQALYYCPVCKHHKRKLEVCLAEGPKFGFFNCWTCLTVGSLGKLFKIVNASKECRDRLYSLTKDIRIIRKMSPRIDSSILELPDEFQPLSIYKNSPEYKNALMYLKQRGILCEDIIRYNLGYCETGEYEFSIIIPSYNLAGELNFFVGRRYYDTPDMYPHKKAKYPMENVIGFESFVNYKEPLVLVESVFNAITIRNNAIPLFGKNPQDKLYEAMILNKVEKVYVCLDSDAKEDAINICIRLRELGITPYLVNIVGGKDPNEIGFEKIHDIIRNTKEFTEEDLLRYKLKL